jgi:hypothetical protein
MSPWIPIAVVFALALGIVPPTWAQTVQPVLPSPEPSTLAVEADGISFFISGYSGILNLSLDNGFQVAFGSGRYALPSFLLEGDANYDEAQWKATSTSVQVFRAGYRFRGPMKNGPAVAGIVLNQNMRLRSQPLGGETRFRQVSVGVSGGYYFHIGRHFYIYPTGAFTRNTVPSGSTSIGGKSYTVEKYSLNESVHIGWEWGI